MTRSLLLSSLTLSALLASSCVDDGPLPDGYVAGQENEAGIVSVPPALPVGCAPLGAPPPATLSCTGLYGTAGTGPLEKAVPAAFRSFTPSTQLWTDGADKARWMYLPPGTKIDSSKPDGWVFPDGTRVWKEFAFAGKRAETRFFYKIDGIWQAATYKWNETDTEATAVDGGEVPLPGGGAHTIPKNDECVVCHRGAKDRMLGFEQVLLGLPDAKGLTLTTLVAENLLSNPPARTNYAVPDDGTGLSAQALPWIHANCGISCHNANPNAEAKKSKMFLRINPDVIEEPTTANYDPVKMTVNAASVTPNFRGKARIVPGHPDLSLVIQLAETRGTNEAMPPLGTRVVDRATLSLLRDWITRLNNVYPTDAGVALDAGGMVPVAPPDAGVADIDAGFPDAGAFDAGIPTVPDAEVVVPDAGLPDAEVPDAELPDAGEADAEVDAGVPPVVVDPGPVTPPVVDPPVVTPPVVDPPLTPPVVDPPVVTPPVVDPPVVTPPVVEPPVTPPVVDPPVVTPPVVDPPVTPPVVDPVPVDAGV